MICNDDEFTVMGDLDAVGEVQLAVRALQASGGVNPTMIATARRHLDVAEEILARRPAGAVCARCGAEIMMWGDGWRHVEPTLCRWGRPWPYAIDPNGAQVVPAEFDVDPDEEVAL